MPSVKNFVIQATPNADAEVAIPTLLTVDGKSGWMITGVKFSVTNLAQATIPTADCSAIMELNTEIGSQSAVDNDSVAIEYIAVSGIAASVSAFQLQTTYNAVLPSGRLTVQPNLYLHVKSLGFLSGLAIVAEVFYEIVKLTDMEVMRLLQGGA
jgi:hypothetical protein